MWFIFTDSPNNFALRPYGNHHTLKPITLVPPAALVSLSNTSNTTIRSRCKCGDIVRSPLLERVNKLLHHCLCTPPSFTPVQKRLRSIRLCIYIHLRLLLVSNHTHTLSLLIHPSNLKSTSQDCWTVKSLSRLFGEKLEIGFFRSFKQECYNMATMLAVQKRSLASWLSSLSLYVLFALVTVALADSSNITVPSDSSNIVYSGGGWQNVAGAACGQDSQWAISSEIGDSLSTNLIGGKHSFLGFFCALLILYRSDWADPLWRDTIQSYSHQYPDR
jgi:hypothetical protein